MLFSEGKSALVVLSDAAKQGLADCEAAAKQVIELHRALFPSGAPKTVEDLSGVNPSDAARGIALQGELHKRALSTILTCCFSLESYINSLAFYLYKERDMLGLIRGGHDSSAELLFDSIERLSPTRKWEAIAKTHGGTGFDVSREPFNSFKQLFRFRNDLVHDKVTPYGDSKKKRSYGGKLPDPVLGFLTLEHALFAAETYWSMVEVIHKLIRVPTEDFHKHYNLAPWVDETQRESFKQTAATYARMLPNP